MIVLVLAAGSSDAYHAAGSIYPKNLVEIAGKPIIQHVTEWLSPMKSAGWNFVFMIPGKESERFFTSSVIRLMDPDAQVIDVPESTGGAACTALLAIDRIKADAPLLIVNGDILIDRDPVELVNGFARRQLDGGIVIFDGIHPRWSYVRLDEEGYVIEAAEKRPISRQATAGFYWFARGSDFISSAASMLLKNAMSEGAYYIAPVFNEMVLGQKKTGVTTIETCEYHSFKDPADARKYESARGQSLENRG